MTLDEARDRFEQNADTHKACDYLAVAHKYWADGIISDETFSSVIDATLGFIQKTHS